MRTKTGTSRLSDSQTHRQLCIQIVADNKPSEKSSESVFSSFKETNYNDVLGRGIYQFLGPTMGFMSLAYLISGPFICEMIFGITLLPMTELVLRDCAALMMIPAAFCWLLQEGIATNGLDTVTFKRLAVSLALVSMSLFFIDVIYSISKGVMSKVGFWTTSLPLLLPIVSLLKLYGLGGLSDVAPGFMSSVASLRQSDNINATFYAMFSVILMVCSLVCVATPSVLASWFLTMPVNSAMLFMIRGMGCLIFLESVACFTLKDAADKDRLGFPVFRKLNLAQFIASLAQIVSNLIADGKTVNASQGALTVTEGMSKTAMRMHSGLLSQRGRIAVIVIFGSVALLSGLNAMVMNEE